MNHANRRTGIPFSNALLQLRDHPLKMRANLLGGLLQLWVVDRLHRCDRIDSGNFRLPAAGIADHDVTGQHRTNLIFQLQGLVCQFGLQPPKIR